MRHIADGYQDASCQAALTGRAERRGHDGVRAFVDFRVGHDDQMVLCAAERLHSFTILGCILVNIFGNRGGTDERNGANQCVAKERIHGFFIAMQQVEDACRQPGLVEQFRHARGRERNLFRRLEDETVSAGDGERVHPGRHHRGEIEGRNAGANPERLADGLAIDTTRDIFERLAHHQARHAAAHFYHLDGPANLGAGIIERFAVFRSQRASQFFGVLLQQILIAIEHLNTVHNRYFPPLEEGFVRRANSPIDVIFRSVGNARDLPAGSRIGDRIQSRARRLLPLPVHKEFQRFGGGFRCDHPS